MYLDRLARSIVFIGFCILLSFANGKAFADPQDDFEGAESAREAAQAQAAMRSAIESLGIEYAGFGPPVQDEQKIIYLENPRFACALSSTGNSCYPRTGSQSGAQEDFALAEGMAVKAKHEAELRAKVKSAVEDLGIPYTGFGPPKIKEETRCPSFDCFGGPDCSCHDYVSVYVESPMYVCSLEYSALPDKDPRLSGRDCLPLNPSGQGSLASPPKGSTDAAGQNDARIKLGSAPLQGLTTDQLNELSARGMLQRASGAR